MSQEKQTPPQLPSTSAIQNRTLTLADGSWFEYAVRAQPHHTDYAGIVWHGSYIVWMEEARVECLRSIGIEFADLVALLTFPDKSPKAEGAGVPAMDVCIR